MTLIGMPWKTKKTVSSITDRIVPQTLVTGKGARLVGLKGQGGAVPSFFVIMSSFILGIAVAGIVLAAYSNIQRLLKNYQSRLDQSAHSLAQLTDETKEILDQMNLALLESQKKIDELEQMKTSLAQAEPKVEEPKPVLVEATPPPPATPGVATPVVAAPEMAAPVMAPQPPLVTPEESAAAKRQAALKSITAQIKQLTREGIPQDAEQKLKLISLCKKKINLRPNDPATLMMIGTLSEKVGDYEQAVRYLELALDHGGQIREVVTDLARVYEAWEKPQQADHYRQILAGL